MRCLSCNKILNDFESTRKYANTMTYVDMCLKCFGTSDKEGVDVIERADLSKDEPIESEVIEFEEDGSEYMGCGNGPCG